MSGTHRNSRACQNHGERLIGQVIGSYRLHRLIGCGGMGLVFEGVHQVLGQRAAIKLVHAEGAQYPHFAARIVTEARAASLLNHPGVVRVLDIGQTHERVPYIVLEFLDGVLLTQRLHQLFPGLPPGTARSVTPSQAKFVLNTAYQISEALAAMHEKGVIHRDLKPDNIFVVADPQSPSRERIKIFDFGLAKLTCDPPAADGEREGKRTQLTAIGAVLGTPVYMSPEQWLGRTPVTDRADVYAAGGIFYELLVGHPPFVSQVLGVLMRQHLHEAPPPILSLAPWVDPPLAELVASMLVKSPSERPSMQEVSRLLAGYVSAASAIDWSAAPLVQAPTSSMLARPLPAVTESAPMFQTVVDQRNARTQILAAPPLPSPPAQMPVPVPMPPQARAVRKQEQSGLPFSGMVLISVVGLLLTGVAAWLLAAPAFP